MPMTQDQKQRLFNYFHELTDGKVLLMEDDYNFIESSQKVNPESSGDGVKGLLSSLAAFNKLDKQIVKIISDELRVDAEGICKENGITYFIKSQPPESSGDGVKDDRGFNDEIAKQFSFDWMNGKYPDFSGLTNDDKVKMIKVFGEILSKHTSMLFLSLGAKNFIEWMVVIEQTKEQFILSIRKPHVQLPAYSLTQSSVVEGEKDEIKGFFCPAEIKCNIQCSWCEIFNTKSNQKEK